MEGFPEGLEYYKRFPIDLRTALIENIVTFPETLQQEYEERVVYRAIKYNSKKTCIDQSDFASYIEKRAENPMIPVDDSNISSYSCSCYMDLDKLHIFTKFPTKNKAVAKGSICDEIGPVVIDKKRSHVDWFLFEGVDPSDRFEVIEKWEKSGYH